MVKPEDFDVIFGNPRKVYRSGDVVTGSLILNIDQPQSFTSLTLKFSGKSMVAFSRDTGGKRKQHFIAKELYLSREVRLLPGSGDEALNDTEGCVGGSTIDVGRHEFPFTYKLPNDIPSSFESFTGNVRYCVKATLEKGWKMSQSFKKFFAVIQPLDLNDISDARLPAENSEESTLCCLCCASGNLEGRVSIPKRGFVPGEAIPIRAEVTNNSRTRISKMYFTIDQVARCHAMGKTDTSYKTLTTGSAPKEHSGIAAGLSDTWTGTDLVTVPIATPTGLPNCGIIDIEHRLVLNIVPQGMSCTKTVAVNIMIGTKPLASDRYNSDEMDTLPSYDSGYSFSSDTMDMTRQWSPANHEIRGRQPPAYAPSSSNQRHERHQRGPNPRGYRDTQGHERHQRGPNPRGYRDNSPPHWDSGNLDTQV